MMVGMSVLHNMRILANLPVQIDENDLINDHVNDEPPEQVVLAPDLPVAEVANLLRQGRAERERVVQELEAARGPH